MENIVINNASYIVQRVFVGQHTLSDVIGQRVQAEKPQNLPLTKNDCIQYNDIGDCSVVRRHNGQ